MKEHVAIFNKLTGVRPVGSVERANGDTAVVVEDGTVLTISGRVTVLNEWLSTGVIEELERSHVGYETTIETIRNLHRGLPSAEVEPEPTPEPDVPEPPAWKDDPDVYETTAQVEEEPEEKAAAVPQPKKVYGADDEDLPPADKFPGWEFPPTFSPLGSVHPPNSRAKWTGEDD